MWQKIHRWFSCCDRTEEQNEMENVQQQEEEKNVQHVAKEAPRIPTGAGMQERQMFLRKFCAMYNRLTDELSVNSSRERDIFLRECHGMYNRVMEELLMGSPRDTLGGLPASAPPACGILGFPHHKGKQRQRRRGRSAATTTPSSSSSASSSNEEALRGRRKRRPS